MTLMALTSALVLASCNQAQTPVAVVTDPANSGSTGVITFTLKPAADTQSISGQALPTPTNVRVLFTNAATGFKLVKDVTVGTGASTVEARVPARDGYKVEAFSYLLKTQFDKRVLKDGLSDNVTVAAGATTQISMTLQPIVMKIIIPSAVVAGAKFTATYDQPRALGPFAYFNVSSKAFAQDTTANSGVSGSFKTSLDLNAPASDTVGNMYVQAYRFIDERFMESGDLYVTFVFYSPSVENGDAPLTAILNVPEGGIGVGISY